MKSDEAVAPVVAVLLILAVIVTLMSLYYSTYVPSLKQQAEIGHIGDVEREFLSFSSDIENAVWKKSEGKLGRNIELGGGDLFLSGMKSGGFLMVEEDSTLFGVSNTTGDTINSSLVRFSYESLGNFWQDQCYSWQYGYVNLTTEYCLSTPLQYTDMNAVINSIRGDSGIFSSMFDLEYKYLPVFEKDATENFTGKIYENCSELSVTITDFDMSENRYISGNGPARLSLDIDEKITSYNETLLNFTVYEDVSCDVNIPFWKSINDKLLGFQNEAFENIRYVSCYPDAGVEDYGKLLYIEFTSPVKVNIRQLNLTVSVF